MNVFFNQLIVLIPNEKVTNATIFDEKVLGFLVNWLSNYTEHGNQLDEKLLSDFAVCLEPVHIGIHARLFVKFCR